MNVLSFLGIGKKDAEFKLSKVVLDSVAKVGTLDAEALKAEVSSVMGHISPLGEGSAKDMLVSAVKDSFNHPVEVTAKKDEVAKVIDGLFAKCTADDEAAAKAVLDAFDEKKEEKKEEDEKDEDGKKKEKKEVKDTAVLIEEAIQKSLAGVTDSLKKDLSSMVDATVKEALGLGKDTKKDEKPVTDAAADFSDFDDLVRQAHFGAR
jgi:hypothetical protein